MSVIGKTCSASVYTLTAAVLQKITNQKAASETNSTSGASVNATNWCRITVWIPRVLKDTCSNQLSYTKIKQPKSIKQLFSKDGTQYRRHSHSGNSSFLNHIEHQQANLPSPLFVLRLRWWKEQNTLLPQR